MTQSTRLPDPPHITILMAVHNGARFLPAQLESIAAQHHQNWHLICSDDHSTDSSAEVIAQFAKAHPGKVSVKSGPGEGFAANFLSLIGGLPPTPGFVSFADQDDIWLPGKLRRGLSQLAQYSDEPALGCGRRLIWYPTQNRRVKTPRLCRAFTLRNALIENVASGNTIMLNPQAAALARSAALRTRSVFTHDWWLYLLMTATGGRVVHDNGPPQVLYRQHSGNILGAGQGASAQMRRKLGVLRGAFSDRLRMNLSALEDIDDLLTPEARHLCQSFAAARGAPAFSRLVKLRQVAPYRQSRRATLGFWGAASLGLI